jgi:hypothetical protein
MMMTWWAAMSIDSVLTEVQQHVSSFKQCWVFLQAARCDNSNSVTTSFTTSSAVVLHLRTTPPPPLLLTDHSLWSPQLTRRPRISLCHKAAGVFQKILKMLHFDNKIYRIITCRYFFLETQISSIAADVASLECCRRHPSFYLTLAQGPWISPDTCPNRLYAVKTV